MASMSVMTSSSGSPPPPVAATSAATVANPLSRAFVSGAVAGVVADSMLHPLDTVNLRMKIQKQSCSRYSSVFRSFKTILREEGIRGCFGGLGTTLMLSPVCAAVYFGTYESIKAAAPTNDGAVYFAAGALSEVVISAISVPTEVIKSRLQLGRNPHAASGGVVKYTHNYKNTVHAAMTIVRSEGIRGLYSGYSACLSVDTFFSAFSFLFYEKLKHAYSHNVAQHRADPTLTTSESLAMGSLAGGMAAFLTNPLDVVTVRLMTQAKSQREYSGFRQCLVATAQREGIRGLWKGGLCRTMAVMPSTGICFGVYETIKHTFYKGELEDFDLDELL